MGHYESLRTVQDVTVSLRHHPSIIVKEFARFLETLISWSQVVAACPKKGFH